VRGQRVMGPISTRHQPARHSLRHHRQQMDVVSAFLPPSFSFPHFIHLRCSSDRYPQHALQLQKLLSTRRRLAHHLPLGTAHRHAESVDICGSSYLVRCSFPPSSLSPTHHPFPSLSCDLGMTTVNQTSESPCFSISRNH
jgi:hypothetical protein